MTTEAQDPKAGARDVDTAYALCPMSKPHRLEECLECEVIHDCLAAARAEGEAAKDEEWCAQLEETLLNGSPVPCVHCKHLVPTTALNHWRECEKHPAHAAIAQAVAEMRERAAQVVNDTEPVVIGRYTYEPFNDTDRTLANAEKAIRALVIGEGD